MRILFVFVAICFSLVWSEKILAQCSDIVLNTQLQVDNFAISYPNCTIIDGDITIEGLSITNLDGLSQIESVSGELRIMGTSITHIDALSGVTGIVEAVMIIDCDLLENINGLEGIILVDVLRLDNLPNLVDYTGISSLSGIFNLFLRDIPLTSLDIFSTISIENDIDLINLNITSLAGIEVNPILNGDLTIGGCNLLEDFTGCGLTKVLRRFIVYDNAALTSFQGSIIDEMGVIVVGGHPVLTSLAGLESIYHNGEVNANGQAIIINSNPILTDISAFESWEFDIPIPGVIQMLHNTNLAVCNYDILCTIVQQDPFGSFIADNAIGCSSSGQIAASCVCNFVEDVFITTSICGGESYEGYTETGIYVDELMNSDGCLYDRTIDLTVHPSYDFDEAVTICSGESYREKTVSGLYYINYPTSYGCDSAYNLQLEVLQNDFTQIDVEICDGQSYEGYNSSGNYADSYTNVAGCDSTRVLNLSILDLVTEVDTITICHGEIYQGYSESIIVSDSLTSTGGCDSIYTLNLTVLDSIYTFDELQLCSGENFMGFDVDTIFQDTLASIYGCDSIVEITITVDTLAVSYEEMTICSGDSLYGYFESGMYTDTIARLSQCDSVRVVELTVNNEIITSLEISICLGQSYENYDSTGIYVDTFTSTTACDSIRFINLEVVSEIIVMAVDTLCYPTIEFPSNGSYPFGPFPSSAGCDSSFVLEVFLLDTLGQDSTTIDVSICQGEEYQGYTEAGTYIYTLPNKNNCDSIIVLELELIESTITNEYVTICFGETYLGYSESGVYADTLTAKDGCDSISILELLIMEELVSADEMNLCFGETYMGYDDSGTFIDTLISIDGCDSIRTLELSILDEIRFAIDTFICPNDDFMGYTTTGVYNDTLTATNGCDSLLEITLTVLDADNTLCTNAIVKTDLISVKIYPNPVNDYLRFDGFEGELDIVITDITGRQMMRKTIRNNHNLDVNQLSNGVYFLFAEGTFIDRFVKQ